MLLSLTSTGGRTPCVLLAYVIPHYKKKLHSAINRVCVQAGGDVQQDVPGNVPYGGSIDLYTIVMLV